MNELTKLDPPTRASSGMTRRTVGLGVLSILFSCSSSGGASGIGSDGGPARAEAGRTATHDGGNDARLDGHHDAAHEASRGGDRDATADALGDAAEEDAKTAVDGLARDASADGGWVFVTTTTTGALTQNNTSACGSNTSPCSGAWNQTESVHYGTGTYSGTTRTVDAFWDHAVPAGPRASGSGDGYVSKIPMSVLLPGYGVPVWVETQDWWGNGSGHIDNGEVSSSGAQIQDQITDHLSRGISGQVLDWYGPGTTADTSLPFLRTAAEAASGKYQFAVMIDKGYFVACGETVACLNSAIAYLVQKYTGSSAYLTDGDGHPLLFFFINSFYPTQYAILQSSGIDYQGTKLVMYEPDGFPGNDPPNTLGEYGWVNPSDGTYTSSTGSAGTFATAPDFGFADLTSFLGAAKANSGSFAVSEAHKGFEDNLANWSLDRIIDQRCGQTWLQTFHHTGSYGGSSTYLGNLDYLASGGHLDFVMVDTWDDYEEGTEIETGIDNCLSSLDVSLSGSMLSWTPTWGTDPMSSAVMGTEATVYKYSVYLAEQGSSTLMWLSDVACSSGTCGHSLDLSTLGITGGPYVLYVRAVGFPSIVNTLSSATSATFSGH